jgi:hypothetical protein
MEEINRGIDDDARERTVPSRRSSHPQESVRISDLADFLRALVHLQPARRVRLPRRYFARPRDIPATSRARRRRRLHRLRRRRWLIGQRVAARSALIVVGVVGVIALAFWARFAIIYHLPPYLQHGTLANASGYVVIKPWWFGPSTFDLAQYSPQPSLNPVQGLAAALGNYRDVVVRLANIIFVW